MDYQAQRILMNDIDSLYDGVMKSVGKELMSHPTIKRTFSLQKSGLESGSLLPLYRHMNTEEWGRDRVDLHWKELLRRSTPENVGPARVAIYEARNLYMMAEIQRMVSQHPGERVLVVVGASHKPLFDAYLRQMMGVKVVDADEVIPGM
jgi:pheromone shutdown protein TraB